MLIKVIEHQKIKISKKNNAITPEISFRSAEYLKNIELLQNKEIFRWGHNQVTPQQWVGVIRTPEVTIEILPKITDSSNENIVRESFVNMLKVAHNIPMRKNISANLSIGNHGFIDILASIFLKELEILINRGVFRSYIKDSRYVNAVKGKINFTKQVNNILKNKFHCSYSILSEDNYINQIIKYTLHVLSQLVKDTSIKNLIKKIYVNYNNVKLIEIKKVNTNKFTLDRQNVGYDKVLDYCKLFINGNSLDISTGKKNVNFLLFDMNKLFELYISKMYQKIYKNVQFQTRNHYLLESLETKKRRKIELKPDIIINFESEKIIIDTKWKLSEGFASELDIYQMNAYLAGFSSVSKAILLYPKSQKNDKMKGEYQILNGINEPYRIKIVTVDLTKLGDEPAFFKYLKEIIKFKEQ